MMPASTSTAASENPPGASVVHEEITLEIADPDVTADPWRAQVVGRPAPERIEQETRRECRWHPGAGAVASFSSSRRKAGSSANRRSQPRRPLARMTWRAPWPRFTRRRDPQRGSSRPLPIAARVSTALPRSTFANAGQNLDVRRRPARRGDPFGDFALHARPWSSRSLPRSSADRT
jgi:hypothetical protein